MLIVIFCFLHSTFINWNSSVRESCLLPPFQFGFNGDYIYVCIYTRTHIRMYTCIYVYILFCGLCKPIISLGSQIILALDIESSCRMAPVLFWHTPSFLSAFFLIGTIRCSMLLYFPCPTLKNWTTSQRSSGTFFGRKIFRNQDLGTIHSFISGLGFSISLYLLYRILY